MSAAEPPRVVDDARSTRGDEVAEIKTEEIKREEITTGGRTVEKVEKKVEKEEVAVEERRAPEEELVRRTTTRTTVIDPPDHHHHHQDLAIVVPRGQMDREIRREIRALEAEREALRYEREGDWSVDRRRSGGDWDMVLRERDSRDSREYDRYHRHRHVHRHDHSRPREVLRVERDPKGRLGLIRSRH
jgi:hypothetical protein